MTTTTDLHNSTCWDCVIEDIQENAAECFDGRHFGATEQIPGWYTTVYELAASYLTDGGSSCRCDVFPDAPKITVLEHIGL